MQDVNFDSLFERFKKNISDTEKGQLRHKIIIQCLEQYLPDIVEKGGKRIADVGGGLGQFSQWFSERNNSVDYYDLSERMVAHARQSITECGLDSNCQFFTGRFQKNLLGKQYSLVFVQAVVEWLDDPVSGLRILADAVEPDGYLCLVFFNRYSIQIKNLLKGNINKAFSNDYSGDLKGLTPINPIEPNLVYQHLVDSGFTVIAKRGIRTFSDYLFPHVDRQKLAQPIMDAELKLSEQEPYISMARYICVIARKKN